MTSLLGLLNSGMPDATALAAAVRGGEITAAEVLALARGADDPDWNIFVTADWTGAEAVARRIDEKRSRGEELGALAGVPITVKDVLAVAGLPATAACKALSGNIATVTAPVVARLLAADAVLLGKTNCPEFAFGVTCDSPLVGRTRNPRFPTHSPGGSSGGEAAALAAGVSALGVGTDFGGSLRWPAQCVGITALRPTAGRLPAQGQLPGTAGDSGSDPTARPGGMQGWLQTPGPLARSVRDLRLTLRLMAGPPPDLTASPLPGLTAGPPPGFAAGPAPSATERRIGRLRVVWSDGAHLGPVRAEITALLADLATRLAERGHAVTNEPRVFDCLDAYNRLRAVDPLHDHLAAIAGSEDLVTAANRRTFADSLRATAAETRTARIEAEHAQTEALTVFERADIVLLPVAGGPACDPDGRLEVDGRLLEGWELMGQCRAVSLTGAPAVSIPLGRSAEGLPLSVQVVAAPGRDEFALDAAELLESLAPA
ncbi:amidase [Nocardia inohanensis]|uniref:amidase n=1 Tax=Nocardia inohanensis TaxID=209246 RepID=UPI000A76DCE4|nr:amidase [Nocardia inohanensis]